MNPALRLMAVQAAVAGWSPPSGTVIYLKPDTLGLSDTDPISTWVDQSGSGNDVTSTSTNRPLYRTGIINGLPVVRFDGSNDLLERVPGSFTLAQPFTAALVVRFASFPGFSVLFDSQVTTPCTVYTDAGNRLVLNATSDVTDGVRSTATTYTVVAVFNGASSKMYVNGGAAAVSGNPGSNGLNGIRLGLSRSSGAALAADLGDVVVCNSALGLTDINSIGDQFATRYGHTWTTAT